jgi:hypothetical protein
MANKTLIFFSFLSFCSALSAQQSINTAGGNSTGVVGNVSYSIGQVFYSSNNSASGSFTEGVQQTYTITSTSIPENAKIKSMMIYPNPTNDNLIISVEKSEHENMNYRLFDFQGKLIQSGNIVNKETMLQIKDLSEASYFLDVIQEDRKLRTFKIIKNR